MCLPVFTSAQADHAVIEQCRGVWRVHVQGPLGLLQGFVLFPALVVDPGDGIDDHREWIELESSCYLCLRFSVTSSCRQIDAIEVMRRGIVGIEFDGMPESLFRAAPIPVV